MSRINWMIVAAIGLALPVGVLAQEIRQSVPEGKLIAKPQQEQSAPPGNSGADRKNDATIDVTPFLKGIETAIRDTIAKENKAGRQESETREKRDLAAQEAMATWAKWTVILTFAALVAIIRTLHHTRRAADYADAMVKEAKETTKAAIEATAVTREIGERQTRAYICIDSAVLKEPVLGNPIQASVTFKNTGQSPAYNVSGWCRIVAGEKAFSAARKDGSGIMIQFGDIGGNVTRSFPYPAETTSPHTPNIANHIRKGGKIYVFGELRYFDAFKREPDIKKATRFRYFYRSDSGSSEEYTMLADEKGNNST